eukprot:Protomagalhaensia_wolfi_Nauph_80__2806@NODE_2916_length_946_cov_22_188534_g2288_i0_p1_GENE_NODE_2916_length_946_cov_22_188534_g2288_i0NODE_2916_length_946_cov_22_188534_g2288_i0_p1_ORF_typecomplete_len270_score21_51_NODE_2916_length_946_cov_22_188534_g2288_i02811
MGQTSRSVRELVRSREMEIEAFEEWLRRGAPQLPLTGWPFHTGIPADYYVINLRRELWRHYIQSWHSGHSVLKLSYNEPVRLEATTSSPSNERNNRKRPFRALPSMIANEIKEDEWYLESDAWDTIRKIMSIPAARCIALLKFHPEYREMCLTRPYTLIEWSEGKTKEIPIDPSEVAQKLNGIPLPKWKDFCSWQFITGEIEPPSEDLRSTWTAEATQKLRLEVKKKRFKPYIDSPSNRDPDGTASYVRLVLGPHMWLEGQTTIYLRTY